MTAKVESAFLLEPEEFQNGGLQDLVSAKKLHTTS